MRRLLLALLLLGIAAAACLPGGDDDDAEEVGDLEVENFPTIRVTRGEQVLFHGTLLPMHEHLRKLLEKLLEGA